MAARVAAQLRKDPDLQVQTIKGGLGEFSVLIEGIKLIDANRLWYPRPSRVVRRVLDSLAD